MLSEEKKKAIAVFVRADYGIGGMRFPQFIEKLEKLLGDEPVCEHINKSSYACGGSYCTDCDQILT